MKCLNCGAELTDDAKFCSYCGSKIPGCEPELTEPSGDTEKKTTATETVQNEFSHNKSQDAKISYSNQLKETADCSVPKSALGAKIKAKLHAVWGGMGIFGRLSTVSFAVVALLFLIAICSKKWVAVFFSVIQLAGLIVATFMHKSVIKLDEEKKWIKYLVLAVVMLFSILNIMSYSWGRSNSGKPDSTYLPPASHTSETSKTPVVITALTPYDAAECVGKKYSTIKSDFGSAGFSSIRIEKIEDLKLADKDKVDTIESISVGGKTNFTKGQGFNKNDEVVIRYHVYKKCNATIHVDFIPNLIFSQYNVTLRLNGIDKGTLEHGKDEDFKFAVDPGEYTLTFENKDATSVKGEVSLTIDCDIEASYRIWCHSDKVSVENIYFDRLTELAEGEVKADVAASEYKHKNYAEVEAALRNLGFTNIKYNILYDIVLGWTENGEVDSVSIAGKTDFSRGDVFVSDAEIIITYHMPEDDNPSYITLSTDSSGYDGMNYLDVQQAFNILGFTNIEFGEVTTENSSYTDGEVFLVEISGRSFDAGDSFDPNAKVYIKYYSVEEPEVIETITIENNSDFAALMKITDQTDAETIKKFVNSHIGDVIEFDGCIALMMNHKDYKTRFDVCMAGIDYHGGRVYGPLFSFEDVNFYDMNVSGTDTVAQGMDFRITAEIMGFNDAGNTVTLNPVSLAAR